MKKHYLPYGVFAAYCLMMLTLLFHRAGYEPDIAYADQLRWNLIPFHTIRLYWRAFWSGSPSLRMISVINLGGNIIMFIPLGFLLPPVFPKLKNLMSVLVTTAAIIICVELIQLLTLVGSCDIDDLILNLLGAASGYWIYTKFRKNACSDK